MPRRKYRLQNRLNRSQWQTVSSQSSASTGAQSQVKKKSGSQRYQSILARTIRGEKTPTFKIPKRKLENAIEKIEETLRTGKKPKENFGCHLRPGKSSLRHSGFKRDSYQRLLNECRECLLNQDWTNLAALIAIAKPFIAKEHSVFMPHFLKYAALCALYSGEEESLDNLMYGVIGCATEHDKEVFLSSLQGFVFEEVNRNDDPMDDDAAINGFLDELYNELDDSDEDDDDDE